MGSKSFARYELFAGLFESVCMSCHRLLGVSQDVRRLDIVENAHKCMNCSIPASGSAAAVTPNSVRAA